MELLTPLNHGKHDPEHSEALRTASRLTGVLPTEERHHECNCGRLFIPPSPRVTDCRRCR